VRTNTKVKAFVCLLVLSFFISIAYADFITNTESEFNEGTYSSTYYNTTTGAVQLTSNSGDYTSKIFNANSTATWNNISYDSEIPTQQEIFVIDGQKSVFSSLDGTNWNTKIADYGGTSNLDSLVSTSDNKLILLDNKDIYSSSDFGTSWTKINDLFTPYSQDGIKMTIDNNDNVYIIDGAERVFKSTNQGYNWTEIASDFNSGSTTNAKGFAVNSNNILFAVDGSGDVYSSSNQGLNWTYLSDYGGASATDAMVIDQNDYLYILLDKDIYQSTDSGLNWTKINDRFTPYTNNGLILFFDKIDSLIIVDAIGRVFKSTNQGINWTETGDCNGAATNDPKAGTAMLYTTNLTALVRSCDDASCSGETFTTNLNVSDNQYFQYQFELEADNYDYSPKLYNVTINYSITINITPPDTTPPQVWNVTPKAGSNFSLDSRVDITANVTDNVAIDTVFANLTNPDLSVVLIQLFDDDNDNIYNNSVIANQVGWYYITIIANDTSGNVNNTIKTNFDPASLGGSGSGGGGAARESYDSIPHWRKENNDAIIKPYECIESWLCTEWTKCSKEGQSTRTCDDWNKCKTEETKPITEKECESEEKKESEPRFATALLMSRGRTITAVGGLGIAAIIILLIACIYLLYRKTDKKRKRKVQKRTKVKINMMHRLKTKYKNE
jgi:photosystem II stability/assembly factor-like uncharacterized protein